MSGLKAGDSAPNLTLNDQDGKPVTLSDYWAKGPVVVFFYPKDSSYGCTKEVCRFRDNFSTFTDAGATVFGISKDDAASHTTFIANQKVPFSLLTDPSPEKPASTGFKVRKQMLGLVPGRVTFVIDQQGKIAHVFSSATDFGGHVDQAIEIVKKLAANKPAPAAE